MQEVCRVTFINFSQMLGIIRASVYTISIKIPVTIARNTFMQSKLSGQIFGHYKLDKILGTGGMSLVYRARQTNIERDVAIKIMAPALANQEGFAQRFKQEAEIFAKLEHPHIAPIYDYGQHGKYLYLVLRLIPGGSLSDTMVNEKPFDLDITVKIVKQVASALQYAHDKKIIHRDLKPSNILLDDDNNAYLVDFGIAKIITETRGGAMSALLGTPSYIAPEQWQAQIIDHRVDIYSLGVVVYRMLTGKLPFTSGSPFYLMYSHLHGDIPKPSQENSNIPPELDDIVLKALAKTPSERYETVTEFAEAFEAAIGEKSTTDSDADTKSMLDIKDRRSFRPDTKRDERLDKLWIALERDSGQVYVTPDVNELFAVKEEEDGDDRRMAKMTDIWDELERPPTAVYNTKRLQELLDQIKKEQAFLGVKTQRVKLPEATAKELERESGLLVIAVETDSPAEKGGLYLGDLLVALDEYSLQHQDNLINLLNDERIGQTVKLQFIRTGKKMSANVQLTKRESDRSLM